MRYPLPYAFARSSQLLIEDDGQEAVLWHGPQPDWSAVSEVQRKHGVQRWQLLDAGALAHRISAAYAQSDSSAAMVVSEVEGLTDSLLTGQIRTLPLY